MPTADVTTALGTLSSATQALDLIALSADSAALAAASNTLAGLAARCKQDVAAFRGQAQSISAATSALQAALATPAPSPPLLPARKPTGSKSGLPWASCWRNAGFYTSGIAPLYTSWENWRKRPLDGLHQFMGGWKGRPTSAWPSNAWPVVKPNPASPGGNEGVMWWCGRSGVDAYLTWPLFSDQVPAGKLRFVAAANGEFDQPHRDVADLVISTGANVRVIRLGHEWTMGSVYPWGLAYAEGDAGVYKAAYARIANILKAKFPNALIDFNALRKWGGAVAGTTFDDWYPGDDVVDIISADQYGGQDFNSAADLKTFMTAGDPAHPSSPQAWAQCAIAHNKLISVPEWSPTVPPGKAATRDYPDYIRAMWEFFLEHATILAYEANFPTDDPSSGLHSMWDPVSVPQCSAAYRDCYQRQWTAA